MEETDTTTCVAKNIFELWTTIYRSILYILSGNFDVSFFDLFSLATLWKIFSFTTIVSIFVYFCINNNTQKKNKQYVKKSGKKTKPKKNSSKQKSSKKSYNSSSEDYSTSSSSE